jgi:hypothetical protein
MFPKDQIKKDESLRIEYEYRFANPRWEWKRTIINKAHRWMMGVKKEKVLKVLAIEEGGKAFDLEFTISKYKNSKTVHIEPKKGETAEDFFERFHPIAKLEYEHLRERMIQLASDIVMDGMIEQKQFIPHK